MVADDDDDEEEEDDDDDDEGVKDRKSMVNLAVEKPAEEEQAPKREKCEFCDKAYTSRANLRKHTREQHAPDGSAWPCKAVKCKFTSITKSVVNAHIKEKHRELSVYARSLMFQELAPCEGKAGK